MRIIVQAINRKSDCVQTEEAKELALAVLRAEPKGRKQVLSRVKHAIERFNGRDVQEQAQRLVMWFWSFDDIEFEVPFDSEADSLLFNRYRPD